MYLVLFSGGMDSFLTVAEVVTKGHIAELLFCSNGSVVAEEHILHGVKRLQNRFGEDWVRYAGAYNTNAIIKRLSANYIHALPGSMPQASICQMQCMICQCAMWVAATAYCEAHGIQNIAAGYKASDTFCTGNKEWLEAIVKFCKTRELTAAFPMLNVPNRHREKIMLDYGFVPRVLEPKCLLGCPANPDTAESEMKAVYAYFESDIRPLMHACTSHLVPILKSLNLSDKSLSIAKYSEPAQERGLF